MAQRQEDRGLSLKVLLTDEDLNMPLVDELCNKCVEWAELSRQVGKGGRKTRSANRRADQLYDEILNFKMPPLELKPFLFDISSQEEADKCIRTRSRARSVDTSISSDSETSSTRPITRSLRSRARTPVAQAKQSPSPAPGPAPATPQHQRIRAHMKQQQHSGSVLSAALNQQHPSVSVTKIRQLIRADSAQKKLEEEKERQKRLREDRKAKEERAEAQKKQLLEERAINAKLKREQRLLHAAEVRKAREEARALQKVRDEAKKNMPATPNKPAETNHHKPPEPENVAAQSKTKQQQPQAPQQPQQQPQPIISQPQPQQQAPTQQNLNETFKKPSENIDNIEMSIHDETTDETRDNTPVTATWARAPHLRTALINQYSKPEAERVKDLAQIFSPVKLPVELSLIFGASKKMNPRYMVRTSSAVWSPVHKPLKRPSSEASTPTDSRG